MIPGADGESRTPISTLGRSHNSHYTTPACSHFITLAQCGQSVV